MILSTAMKAFLLLAACSGAEASSVFHPHRISIEDLVGKEDISSTVDQALLEALGSHGIISVSNVNFRSSKDDTLTSLHACAVESQATKEHVYPDGTRRRTMATHTAPGDTGVTIAGIIDHGAQSPKPCEAFDQASGLFRQQALQVTDAFAQRLSAILNTNNDEPLLSTPSGEAFRTVTDIVRKGEHLEHFHSYQKKHSDMSKDGQKNDETIEWHTDQGLFLVFTPGLVVDETGSSLSTSKDFHIKLSDGTSSTVQFDRQDDLVIVLGDGVHQYINNRLSSSSRLLRATPHALSLAPTQDKARVWYGRMVLPPSDALHPQHKQTFGELRRRMIEQDTTTTSLSLGCSGSQQVARQLEASSCEDGELWCWHRCMPVAPVNVSEAICSSQDLDLACINPERELWNGEHADANAGYGPGCIDLDTAKNATGTGSHSGDHNKTAANGGDHDSHDSHDHDSHDGHDHGSSDDSAAAKLLFGSSWAFGTALLVALSFY